MINMDMFTPISFSRSSRFAKHMFVHCVMRFEMLEKMCWSTTLSSGVSYWFECGRLMGVWLHLRWVHVFRTDIVQHEYQSSRWHPGLLTSHISTQLPSIIKGYQMWTSLNKNCATAAAFVQAVGGGPPGMMNQELHDLRSSGIHDWSQLGPIVNEWINMN